MTRRDEADTETLKAREAQVEARRELEEPEFALSSEQRQRFLLELGDAMRIYPEAGAKVEVAARKLGELLKAKRVLFAEFEEPSGVAETLNGWLADGAEPFPSGLRLADFEGSVLDDLRDGRTVRIDDVASLPQHPAFAAIVRVGVGALLSVPLIDGGKLVVNLSVHHDGAHRWTDDEVALVSEAAQRLWAEVRRARAEAALGASEAKYRSLFDSIDEGLAIVEMIYDRGEIVDMIYRQVNAAYERHGGVHDVVGRSIFDVLPGIEDVWLDRYKQVARTGQPIRVQDYQRDVDRWFEVYFSRVDNDGRFVAIVFADISARKRAEIALRESEERRDLALEGTQLGTFVWHVQEDRGEPDARMLALFNQPPNGGLNLRQALSTMIHPDDGPRYAADVANATRPEGSRKLQSDIRVRRHDGGWRWLEIRARVSFSDDGQPLRMAGTALDITDRKAAEITRREAQDRQAFLLKLSDILRGEVDPRQIERIGLDLLATHLSLDRAYITTSDYEKGETEVPVEVQRTELPSLPGVYRHSEFPESARLVNEGSLVIDDVGTTTQLSPLNRQSFEALRIGALIGIGLRKGVSDVFWTLAAAMIAPRSWTPGEVLVMEEAAERILAAIARASVERALRESEERLRQFGEASQDVLWIRDAKTLAWTYLTPAFESIYGVTREEALRGDTFRNWLDLVLPEDREHARAMIDRVLAGEFVDFEYRIRRRGDGAIRWLRDTDFPIRGEHGLVVSLGGIGQDVTSAKLAGERLRTSEERLRSAAEVAKFALWDWNLHTDQVTWSDEHFRMQGYAVGEVTPSYEAWFARVHPEDRPAAEATLQRARDTRTEYVLEFRSLHPDGSTHWLSARGRFFYDDAGTAVRMVGVLLETTERREWEERQKVLVAELQHRTFNLMAMVSSTADATMRSSANLEEFGPKFRDRIGALARVQRLLSRLNDDDRVTFDELIRNELDAIGANQSDGRVVLDGPAGVALKSRTVQTFAMALHELTTNAVKYGALNQAGARLTVRWRIMKQKGQPWLHVDWRETGVSMPKARAAAQGTGQGRALIEKALPYQLRARATYDLTPDGVHCTIALPVSARTKAPAQ